MTERHVDVLVIGGGIVGLSVAWAASATRACSVAVLEQAHLGHAGGASRGDARMRVLAGYPDQSYLARGLAAADDWALLERDSGLQLTQATGCLSWGTGQEEMGNALRLHDVAFEMWAQHDVSRGYPGVTLPRGTVAIHQPDAGIIHADRAVAAFAAAARHRGTEVHEDVQVTALHRRPGSVQIHTNSGVWAAEQVVVCAGRWAPALLRTVGIALDVTTTSQTVCYYPLDGRRIPPGLIEYGLPDPYALYSPQRGIKAALHAAGPVVHAGAGTGSPAVDAIRATSEWVADRFTASAGVVPTSVETCVYTSTPDERFVIERHDRIIVVSACSGHGFQYAPHTGRTAAGLL